MRINIFRKISFQSMLCRTFLLLSLLCVISCKEDEDPLKTGTPYFLIEGEPSGLIADVSGKEQAYIVRSNRPWRFEARSEGSWVRVFPDCGEADGIFKIIVKENPLFERRIMNLAIVVGKEEEPVYFRVEQDANVPYLKVDEPAVSIPADGGKISIPVKANVNWEYTLPSAEWILSAERVEDILEVEIAENLAGERTALLSISSPEYPDLALEVELKQSSADYILEEDFNWLTYGSAVHYETTGETRYDLWTEAERNRGWYSTPNTFTKNEQLCYARQGFVKLGKTNYGGDFISPKLAKIKGEKDILVTFKACAYISSGGTKDDRDLYVSVIGPGTVSQSYFEITNYPNSSKVENGPDYDVWAPEIAERSFVVTGATAETQIKFLGGDYNLVGVAQGKNRIFLDDVKVVIVK